MISVLTRCDDMFGDMVFESISAAEHWILVALTQTPYDAEVYWATARYVNL